MSLLSPHAGVIPPTDTGQTPVDDLYAKLAVAAAIFLVSHEVDVLVISGWPPAGKPWVDHHHFALGRDFLNTRLGGCSFFFWQPARPAGPPPGTRRPDRRPIFGRTGDSGLDR